MIQTYPENVHKHTHVLSITCSLTLLKFLSSVEVLNDDKNCELARLSFHHLIYTSLTYHDDQLVGSMYTVVYSYLFRERNIEYKYNDALTCNEHCHDVSNKEKLRTKEQNITKPSYTHHYSQRYGRFDPIPEKISIVQQNY